MSAFTDHDDCAALSVWNMDLSRDPRTKTYLTVRDQGRTLLHQSQELPEPAEQVCISSGTDTAGLKQNFMLLVVFL